MTSPNAESGLGGVPSSGRAGEDQPYAEPVGQTAKPLAHNAELERVIAVLKIQHDYPLKASEIANAVGITPGAARRALQALAADGHVFQNKVGYWQLAP